MLVRVHCIHSSSFRGIDVVSAPGSVMSPICHAPKHKRGYRPSPPTIKAVKVESRVPWRRQTTPKANIEEMQQCNALGIRVRLPMEDRKDAVQVESADRTAASASVTTLPVARRLTLVISEYWRPCLFAFLPRPQDPTSQQRYHRTHPHLPSQTLPPHPHRHANHSLLSLSNHQCLSPSRCWIAYSAAHPLQHLLSARDALHREIRHSPNSSTPPPSASQE